MPAYPDIQHVRGEHSVILFDGVCNLCNGTVNFIIDHDPAGRFTFAALQSEEARMLLEAHHVSADAPDTVVLVEDGRVYARSDAALRVARRLSGLWPLLYAFILVPRFIRDRAYRLLADNRYRWFGKQETCRVPTLELRARFL